VKKKKYDKIAFIFTIIIFSFFVFEKYGKRTPPSAWVDTEFEPSGNKTSMFFGPKFLTTKLYQLSPVQVITCYDKSLF